MKPEKSTDHVVPHNLEAEQAVIASLLIDPDAILQVIDFLQPGDFYAEQNGAIYSACLVLYKRGVALDQVTVSQELERQGKLAFCGGPAYLLGLIANIPTSLHVAHYGELVHNLAYHRRLITTAGQIAAIGYEAGKVEETTAKAWKLLQSATQQGSRGKGRPGDLAEAVFGLLVSPEKRESLHLPWRTVEELTGALLSGDLWVLGAHTKIGKTTLLLQIALSLVEAGKTVLYCTAEEQLQQIGMRLVAMRAGISMREMSTGELEPANQQIISDIAGWVRDSGLWVVPCFSTQAIEQWYDLATNEAGKVDLVIVDYLQLFRAAGENFYEKTSLVSNTLKRLATGWAIPVLTAAQLNRKSESRLEKRPALSDLRDSGVIEQDASVVLFLHRGEKGMDGTESPPQLIVAANRLFGQLGTIDLKWNPKFRRYDEPEGD